MISKILLGFCSTTSRPGVHFQQIQAQQLHFSKVRKRPRGRLLFACSGYIGFPAWLGEGNKWTFRQETVYVDCCFLDKFQQQKIVEGPERF